MKSILAALAEEITTCRAENNGIVYPSLRFGYNIASEESWSKRALRTEVTAIVEVGKFRDNGISDPSSEYMKI